MTGLRQSTARLAIFWGLAVALQWLHGAYHGDRAADVDEPAHIVTGLMAREYLVSGAPRSPIGFAREYYLHYPKVALGHWPPVFYAEQAAWTLLFPTSRNSLLVLLALQLAGLASLLWIVLRDRFGPSAAWCGALVLQTLPGVQEAAGEVLTEIAVALPLLLAVLAWVRFLNRGSARSAAAFGLWSAAAILTKATAIVLAPVPLLTVVLLGRTDLLRRARFWIPAVIVAALCAPWHLLAPGALHQRVAPYGAPAFVLRRVALRWGSWAVPFGRPFAVLAAIGLAVLLWRRFQGRRPDALLATAAAVVVCATLGRWVFKVWDARHLVESAPLFVILAASGAGWIAAWPLWQRRSLHAWGRPVVVIASLLVVASNLTPLRASQPVGYRRLAGAILDGAAGPARTILVVGDAGAEGSLIAEIALREPRPRRFAVRGAKLFVDATWMGTLKGSRAGTAAEVYSLLNSLPADLVIIDSLHRAAYPYQLQLEQVLAEHPESWRLALPDLPPGLVALRRVDSPQIADAERAAKVKAALADPAP